MHGHAFHKDRNYSSVNSINLIHGAVHRMCGKQGKYCSLIYLHYLCIRSKNLFLGKGIRFMCWEKFAIVFMFVHTNT